MTLFAACATDFGALFPGGRWRWAGSRRPGPRQELADLLQVGLGAGQQQPGEDLLAEVVFQET
ncbi:hypothetical protein, partial [Kitasatospora cineracea]|uniref:hypothetical protein n=1 Tax=Kitasatospora cineracea TaxID=88074 RepID=UPI0033CDF48C